MRLCNTNLMDGIFASLEETHEVTLNYEMINDEGKFLVLEGTGIFIPDFKCRVFSPYNNFMEPQRLNNLEVSFTVTWEKYVPKISD